MTPTRPLTSISPGLASTLDATTSTYAQRPPRAAVPALASRVVALRSSRVVPKSP